jgi:hypothetical protein
MLRPGLVSRRRRNLVIVRMAVLSPPAQPLIKILDMSDQD